MSKASPLFPTLLGAAFGRLDPPLQVVHRGVSREYTGIATVERGAGWLARFACDVAGLPRSVRAAPLRFSLLVDGSSEQWVRYFAGSSPMRSRVRAERGYLVEQLGPAVLRFALREQEGVLYWRAVDLRVLGIPLPRWAFDFRARVSAHGARYRFEIDARLALLGTFIRYEGELDVD